MSLLFPNLQSQRTLLQGTDRPKIFISYHHSGDQAYYNYLSDKIHDQLDLVFDNSLDRNISSDNPEYIMQRIRDSFIGGTSCTIVLCGAATYQRKYVDWEIKATLDKQHGLIGIKLPTLIPNAANQLLVPDRFAQNFQSGYAIWQTWEALMANPAVIKAWIADAASRSRAKIVNDLPLKAKNG